ncbi:MAG: YceD family protein [Candidatus Acetothermia bacterium]
MEMELELSKLKDKEGEFVPIDSSAHLDSIEFHGDTLEIREELLVTGGAIFTSEETINVSLDFTTTVIEHCRRCLQPIETKIDRHEEIEFRPDMESELDSEGDLSIYRYSPGGGKVDLLPYIVSFIKLDLEPYPLCDEDCKGLCPKCGANLNEEEDHSCEEEQDGKAKDPRMEKLAELL